MLVWPFLVLPILIIISDRVLKFIIFNNVGLGSSIPIIKNILHITPTYNSGIAFGLLRDQSLPIFIIVSVITVFIIIYILFKKPESKVFIWGLLLILSGAIGNLTDRIIYGHVLDFIDLRVWPVFNISDSAITIGAGLLFFYLVRSKRCTR